MNRGHANQSSNHSSDCAARRGAWIPHNEQESAEQASIGNGSDGQSGDEHRAPVNHAKQSEQDAPENRPLARTSHLFGGIGGADTFSIHVATRPRKINHARRSQRIERAAGVGHGHSENRGEHDSDESYGHLRHYEFREEPVGIMLRQRKWNVLAVGVEHHADYKKQRELEEDNYAAGKQSFFAVALGTRREQPLHHGLIGSVAGHGEKCSANYARPKCVGLREAEMKIKD